MEWASALGLSIAADRTEQPQWSNDLPAVIESPATGATVSGVVYITGRAASNDFDS